MKDVPWRVYVARIRKAEQRTRGRRVRVDVHFSKDDLVLIARKGFALTAAGLGAFVRVYVIAAELRVMRAEAGDWST